MIDIISQLMTAFGLATASGLNAYIPLLLTALLAAMFFLAVRANCRRRKVLAVLALAAAYLKSLWSGRSATHP